jgi:hypothetical protein
VIALVGAISAPGAFAADVQFPTDPAHPYSFGLFIGIDGYPNLPESYRLHSCVHDATAMQSYFTNQFHLTQAVLLTEGRATREGVGQALRELVRRVTAAKASLDALPPSERQPLTVVITYSGHGVRVKRLKTEVDPSSDDDAWLCYDSTNQCDRIVRGYELLEVHQQLARLGASVLIISDSCHSGSNYRGIDSSQAQARTIPLDMAPDGPQDNLFAEFAGGAPAMGDAADDRSKPLSGFVFYSACSDGQRAYDVTCGDHSEGRLTHVILDVLENNHGDTTYRDMAAQITVAFAADFPDQTPEFHGAPGKADELFLGKGLPSPEAHIISQDASQHTVTLDLGDLNGVDQKTVFTFYATVDDLLRNQHPVATGSVTDAQPMTCTVLLDHSASVDASAVARYDRPRMSHVVVGVDGDIPGPVADQLQQLARNEQIQLAGPGRAPTLVIHYFAASQTIGIYPPTALPATRPSDPDPVAVRRIAYSGPDDAERFSQNLLYVAGVQRLMSLRHDGAQPLFSASVQASASADENHPPDGLAHVAEHAKFHVKLTNTSTTGLYFTVMGLTQNGDLVVVYPRLPQDADGLIQPGVTVAVGQGRLTASIDGDPPKGAAELTQFKIIASDHHEDLSPLAVPPDTGRHNVANSSRGLADQTDPLFELVRDAVHGGTRGFDEGTSGDVVWQSADVDFDVIKQ